MKYGCQSMVGPIERLLLKRSEDAFVSAENVRAQWQGLNYLGCPDYEKAVSEYERFAALLKQFVPEISYLPKNDPVGLDSIYVFDPVLVTRCGAVLCQMGKAHRRPEPAAIGAFLPALGIPVLGAIGGEGTLEGGDTLWIDERTLAVGRSSRTNKEGIRELKKLTEGLIEELIVVPLPSSVFHLLAVISLVDHDLAVIHARLLPEAFQQSLCARGIKLLALLEEEYGTLGCNILAVAPRKCVMLSGNPRTRAVLEAEGVEVWTYEGAEISLKGEGGPTCLTRPLLRL